MEPLIETRLTPPRLPQRLVSRPRLFDMLNRGTRRSVTLVSGGAGAGKTLLVASWLSAGRTPGPVAWVSVDEDDNDPSHFWSHLLAALRASGAVPPGSPLTDLVPPERPTGSFHLRLLDGLAQLTQPVLIVLDDLHQLSAPAVMRGLAAVLRHPSPALRLVLLTRVDPQLPLQRLRLADQLTEIRGSDLAFTAAEAEDLFRQIGLDMTSTQVKRLLERTEGWVAGLRLAAMSFESRVSAGGAVRRGAGARPRHPGSDIGELVDQFAGDDKTIVDYLLDEVLSGMPESAQAFLLKTSLVDEICAELAAAMTGRPDSQDLLETLERSNAFVVGVGTHRVWYRYHHLFGEALRHELTLRAPTAVAPTHRAAAVWLGERGEPVKALRHAIEAQDWDLAATLIARSALPHVLGPDRETLSGLLRRLPEAQIQTRAGLCLGAAIRAFHLRDVALMCGWAVQAARLAADMDGDDSGAILTGARLAQMAAARLRGDAPGVIEAATSAEKLLAAISPGVLPTTAYQAVISGNRGAALLWMGNLAEAEQDLTAGMKAAAAGQLDLPHMNALGHLALVGVARGELGTAAALAGQAADLAERRGWTGETQVAAAYLALALCHFEWADPSRAHAYLDKCAVAHRADQEAPVGVGLRVATSRFQLAAGDVSAARAALADARSPYRGRELPTFLARLVAVEESDIDLHCGHPELVESRFARLEAAGIDSMATDRERVRLARACLALGRPGEAAETVEPLLGASAANPTPTVEAWLVLALAADRLREDARAGDALARALDLAAPQTLRRPFLTAGTRLLDLLDRHVSLVGTHRPFVAGILEGAGKRAASVPGVPSPLGEPLTDREAAVLRYLPTLLTNAELAGQLYISVNTVKAHLKSLYRKLDVASRREAVHRARDLGLL
jgi:LuxR family maltose regulon positive regulatory protein